MVGREHLSTLYVKSRSKNKIDKYTYDKKMIKRKKSQIYCVESLVNKFAEIMTGVNILSLLRTLTNQFLKSVNAII